MARETKVRRTHQQRLLPYSCNPEDSMVMVMVMVMML
jgi:hypothetical protein